MVNPLLEARRRGVDAAVLIYDRDNRANANMAALNLIAGAGIPIRVISKYANHHDKYVVVDGAAHADRFLQRQPGCGKVQLRERVGGLEQQDRGDTLPRALGGPVTTGDPGGGGLLRVGRPFHRSNASLKRNVVVAHVRIGWRW